MPILTATQERGKVKIIHTRPFGGGEETWVKYLRFAAGVRIAEVTKLSSPAEPILGPHAGQPAPLKVGIFNIRRF